VLSAVSIARAFVGNDVDPPDTNVMNCLVFILQIAQERFEKLEIAMLQFPSPKGEDKRAPYPRRF